MTATTLQVGPTPREVAVFTAVAQAATPTPVIVNSETVDVEAMTVVLSLTAVTGSATLALKLQGVDPITGVVYELGTSTGLALAAQSSPVVKTFRVNVAIPNSTSVAQDAVPPQLLITPTVAGSGTLTYTVTAIMDL